MHKFIVKDFYCQERTSTDLVTFYLDGVSYPMLELCDDRVLRFREVFIDSNSSDEKKGINYKLGALIYLDKNLIGLLKFNGERSFFTFVNHDMNLEKFNFYIMSRNFIKMCRDKYNQKNYNLDYSDRTWVRVNIKSNVTVVERPHIYDNGQTRSKRIDSNNPNLQEFMRQAEILYNNERDNRDFDIKNVNYERLSKE